MIRKDTPEKNWVTIIDDGEEYVLSPKLVNDEEQILSDEEALHLVELRKFGKQQSELFAATEYARNRALEYPSIGDQLDALWKGGEAAEEMLARVQAVKAKYPKPQ